MAIWKRKSAKGIWHTDRENQHAFGSHRAILQERHIIQFKKISWLLKFAINY